MTKGIEHRLLELNLELPKVPKPVAAYIPAIRVGNLLMTSGQLPTRDGELVAKGSVPSEVTLEEAQAATRTAALNALAAVAELAGGLDHIHRIIRVVVYVQSDAGFHGQPAVANGASEFLEHLLGERGKHVRSAVGVSALPLDAPVELELTVEMEERRTKARA